MNLYNVETGEKAQTFEGRGKFSMCVAYVSPTFRNAVVGQEIVLQQVTAIMSDIFVGCMNGCYRVRTENMLPAELRHPQTLQRFSCLMWRRASCDLHTRVRKSIFASVVFEISWKCAHKCVFLQHLSFRSRHDSAIDRLLGRFYKADYRIG